MTVAVHIDAADRFFIAGQNGSGKSVLATTIARGWDRVLVFDPKGGDPEADLPNAHVAYGVDDALRALPGRVIYRPLPLENRDLGNRFDKLAQRIYQLGSMGVVIHELADLAATDRELGPWTAALIRAGGRVRSVPMILVTQRPVNVPRLAKSEAVHFAAFHLVDADDRRTMASYMGPQVASQPVPRDFSFYYRTPDLRLVRVAPLAR